MANRFRRWLHGLAGIDQIVEQLKIQNKHFEKFTMNSTEALAVLTKVEAALTEASTEIPAELQKLRDLIGAGNITPEIEASLGRIDAVSTALAAIIPNT